MIDRVRHAVITVPAYFNDKQRQATQDAGTIAGLNVVRVVNEPTAAALAYGIKGVRPSNPVAHVLYTANHRHLTHHTQPAEERTVLVYDLGGGTFDVSLLSVEEGNFQVIATAGNTRLGGEDFDNRVIQYLARQFKKKHQLDLTKDPKAMGKLKREAEKAKRTLSTGFSTRIEIDGLFNGVDFSETLTRPRFEELNLELFKKTLGPVEQVLKDAKMDKADVTDIVLVGGSTRIPKIRQLVEDYFGRSVSAGINPDEAVAIGATIQAGVSVLLSLTVMFLVTGTDSSVGQIIAGVEVR
jgi:heat shock protein 5